MLAGSNPATPHTLQHEMPRSKPDRRDVRILSAGAVFEKRVFFLELSVNLSTHTALRWAK